MRIKRTQDQQTINVRIKLFAGLDEQIGFEDYDLDRGIVLTVRKGARVKKVVKILRLPDPNSLAFFIDGQQVGLRRRLEDGDTLACLKPVVGG